MKDLTTPEIEKLFLIGNQINVLRANIEANALTTETRDNHVTYIKNLMLRNFPQEQSKEVETILNKLREVIG